MGSHRDFCCSQLSCFVQNDNNLVLAVNNSIINPLFLAPEPSLHYDASLFDAWFGIPFQESPYTTYIRAPHPSEILTLYNLHSLIPLYPSLLSSKHIRYHVLHTLLSCLYNHIASVSFPLFSHLLSRHLPFIKILVVPLLYNQSLYENNGLQPTRIILTQTFSWIISAIMHL